MSWTAIRILVFLFASAGVLPSASVAAPWDVAANSSSNGPSIPTLSSLAGMWANVSDPSDVMEISPSEIIMREVHAVCKVVRETNQKEILVTQSSCLSGDGGRMKRHQAKFWFKTKGAGSILGKFCESCKWIKYDRYSEY